MAISSSFWLDNLSCQNFGGTQILPSQTNVVVIGGGITGISTAYWLSKNGIEVTLLERRRICGGQLDVMVGILTLDSIVILVWC